MFFSVVIPVYNVELYLESCVNSVLSQTFTDYELILVDDGSTDASGRICDAYSKKDDRVRVFHKENGGQSSARNFGVDNCHGEFVVFLDSDDFVCEEHFLEELYSVISDETEVVVYRYYKYFNEDHMIACGNSLDGINKQSKGLFLMDLVRQDSFFCSCWSKTIKLSLLKENKILFDESLRCEDMDWYFSVVEVANNFEVLDKKYICYRQREQSVTSTFNINSIIGYIQTIEKWNVRISAYENETFQYAMFSALAKLYCNLLISYSRHMKELKPWKEQIFSFKNLLRYNLNPRTKIIGKVAKLFGLNLTCVLLKMYDKIR